MNFVEYVESKKQWRTPASTMQYPGLGVAILDKLKKSDPNRVYEILHDSRSHLTVKQIHDQTITAAQNLLNLGVKNNDIVVFFTNCNLKITPLTLACYTIGAPVCFFETYLEQEFVPHYLDKLKPTVIFYQEKFRPMVFNGLNGLKTSTVKHIISLDGTTDQNNAEELLFKPTVDIENFIIPSIDDPAVQPALLAFTSGSTGLPKIIILSQCMVEITVFNNWNPAPGSLIMVLSEIRWLCQIWVMLQPVYFDVTRVFSSIPPLELTESFVREIIDVNKVTHYFEVPKFYITVIDDAERSSNSSTLSSLQQVLLAGEPVSEAFEARFRKITPNCEINRGYGLVETAGIIAMAKDASQKNVNGGVIKKGITLQIVDENRKPLGPNEVGGVCVKLSVPFLGYLSDNKANEETFLEDGWLYTGDLGLMDSDNLLHIHSREKYALRYASGKLLVSYKIENITNNFDGVHSSALVRRPREENSKDDCGTIFVALKEDRQSDFDEKHLINYLRRTLSNEELKIVKYLKVIPELPSTSCFKVDRLLLQTMLDGGIQI